MQRGGGGVLLLVADDLFGVGEELREPVVRVTGRHPGGLVVEALVAEQVADRRDLAPAVVDALGHVGGEVADLWWQRVEVDARRLHVEGSRLAVPRRSDPAVSSAVDGVRHARRRRRSVTASVLDSWFSTSVGVGDIAAVGARRIVELDCRAAPGTGSQGPVSESIVTVAVTVGSEAGCTSGVGSRELTGRKSEPASSGSATVHTTPS